MLVPLRVWFFLLIAVMLVAGGYYRAFERFPLPSSEDERVRTQLAERWAQKVALEVKRLPGRPMVAVARVVNDDDGILTAQLKKWIARRNVLMLNDQWYSGLGYAAGVASEPKSVEEACQALLSANVDYIVAAEVANWTTYPEFEATLVGHVEIRDGKSGETVLRYQLSLPEIIEVVQAEPMMKRSAGVVSVEVQSPIHGSSHRSEPQTSVAGSLQSAMSNESRTMLVTGVSLWLAMIGGFPVVWSRHLKRLLRQRNNRLNFYMLASWIAATGILAGILWLRVLPLDIAVLTGALATICSAIYFGICCQCLEKTL